MANERFWFLFPDKPTTKIFIDEPINFGDADFQLNRKENGMGLDASISGGELKFTFTIHRNHYLEDILYLMHKDGFEADLKFGFSDEIGNEFLGEVDFYSAETNDFDYFSCTVILESAMQIFKRRMATKVDLFANTTVDGEVIEPLVPITMLLQAKPTKQNSEWSSNFFYERLLADGQGGSPSSQVYYAINPCLNIVQSGIEDTLTAFQPLIRTQIIEPNAGEFLFVRAKSNLRNIVVDIKDLSIFFNTDVDNGGNGYVDLRLQISYGLDYSTATKVVLLSVFKRENESFEFNGDLSHTISSLQREEGIWINFVAKVIQSTDVTFPSGTPRFEVFFQINSMITEVTAESSAYNSTPLTFRLIDVMRQIAKSTSNLDIYAPRYENAGQFYDTVLTNGKLLSGNVTDPFYISWEDIEKSINPEHNADSEIQLDKRVFVGIEADYYTNDECWYFDNTQFSSMKKKPNPAYCLNEFKFKYDKYQSLKEATEPNSGSTIHGESIFTPYNKKVENSKECAINWTRDAILLDVQQRLSTKISKDTATQDDDTIFAIDTIETTSNQSFTETTQLNHTWTDPFLSLRNSGDVNFLVLGIKVGSAFAIQAPDLNSGNYIVQTASSSELKLSRVNGNVPSNATNGIRLTKYTYEIKKESIPLTNRTNEGFSVVLNLTTPERYSNLRYSVERNIRNYWNSFLATVNLYHKDKPLRNTFYKNNGKCETEYDGLRVIEKEDWIPDNPIFTGMIYENLIFANVDNADFVALQNALRTRRGFIRTIDNNNRVMRLYPDKMSYVNKSRELNISIAKEKFEKSHLTIVKENGIITINDETRLLNLTYTIESGNKVVLFDLKRQKLYNGVFWDKVTINGANAPTIHVLKEWLDLLG